MIKRRIESVRQSQGRRRRRSPVASSGPVLYGADAPARHGDHRGVARGDHARRLQGVRGEVAQAGQRAAVRRRRPHRGADPPARSTAGALASWKGKAREGADAAGAQAVPRAGSSSSTSRTPRSRRSRCMHFGPKRTAPDYFANSMMAAVFGGGFSSRINMNLREDKGYSYGARGGFGYSKQYGTFSASASVRTDSTYQTLLEIDREVKELWKGKRPVDQGRARAREAGRDPRAPGPVRDRAGRARPVPRPRLLRAPARLLQHATSPRSRRSPRPRSRRRPQSTSSRGRRSTSSSVTATPR